MVTWYEVSTSSTVWLGLSSLKDKIHESGILIVYEPYTQPLTEDEVAALVAKLVFRQQGRKEKR